MIIVAGGSGRHAAVLYEAASSSKLAVSGFCTWSKTPPVRLLDCHPLGQLQQLPVSKLRDESGFIVACGSNVLRQQWSEWLVAKGAYLRSIVHAAAVISPSAQVEAGSALLAGAIVGPSAQIGRGVIVNHCASVDHDCLVGDYVNVSPGVRLGGGARLGSGAFIGMNATILPGIEVGADATIGAGAVVTKDVEPGVTVVGIPARPMPRTRSPKRG